MHTEFQDWFPRWLDTTRIGLPFGSTIDPRTQLEEIASIIWNAAWDAATTNAERTGEQVIDSMRGIR
jgi:hypothetical protein